MNYVVYDSFFFCTFLLVVGKKISLFWPSLIFIPGSAIEYTAHDENDTKGDLPGLQKFSYYMLL